MKSNILFSLFMALMFCSCVQEGGDDTGTISEIAVINKNWTVVKNSTKPYFDSVDNTNPNSIVINGLQDRYGNKENCTYSSTDESVDSYPYGGYYKFDSVTSGDEDICGQLKGIGFSAVRYSKYTYDSVFFNGNFVQ